MICEGTAEIISVSTSGIVSTSECSGIYSRVNWIKEKGIIRIIFIDPLIFEYRNKKIITAITIFTTVNIWQGNKHNCNKNCNRNFIFHSSNFFDEKKFVNN